MKRLCIVTLTLAVALPLLVGSASGSPLSTTSAAAGDPRLVCSCDLPQTAREVDVSGDLAYVAAFSPGMFTASLQIVDIGNKASPVVISTCDVKARGVTVSGDYAYVADGDGFLRIVDVSDPTSPVVTGSCALSPFVAAVAVDGTYAYAVIDGNYYNFEKSSLQVVDISTKTAPVIVGSCALPDYARDIQMAGGYAFVAASGLSVVDITHPGAPVVVGSCPHPDNSFAAAVAVAGDTAYVAGSPALRVIDVSNPAAPVAVGSYTGVGSTSSVAAIGDRAYVSGDFYDDYTDKGGLRVLDVTVAASPVDMGACQLPGMETGGLAVSGKFACVASGGLHVVDLDPAHLTASVTPETAGYDRPVTITGGMSDASGAPLPGYTLALQASDDCTRWRTLKMVTSTTGKYSTSVRVVRKTYFRWSFSGDADYVAMASPSCRVRCRASITPVAMPSTVRVGVKYVCNGLLRPQHPEGKAPLAVFFERFRSGAWRLVATVKGSNWTNISGATRYCIWMRLPASLAGKWRTRTRHEDDDHVRTWSAWRYYTVR